MQCIRLMAMPDRLIAFDELPEDLLAPLEMTKPSGLRKEWGVWLGNRKKVTRIAPERDPYTGVMRKFEPIVEEGPFFFTVDEMLNRHAEAWDLIVDYVKRNAPKDFRLMDDLKKMAIPMAKDVHSEMNIEPEQVLIIPLPKIIVETVAPAKVIEEKKEEVKEEKKFVDFKCEGCEKVFDSEQGRLIHSRRMHKKAVSV